MAWHQQLNAATRYDLAANVLSASGSLRAARLLQDTYESPKSRQSLFVGAQPDASGAPKPRSRRIASRHGPAKTTSKTLGCSTPVTELNERQTIIGSSDLVLTSMAVGENEQERYLGPTASGAGRSSRSQGHQRAHLENSQHSAVSHEEENSDRSRASVSTDTELLIFGLDNGSARRITHWSATWNLPSEEQEAARRPRSSASTEAFPGGQLEAARRVGRQTASAQRGFPPPSSTEAIAVRFQHNFADTVQKMPEELRTVYSALCEDYHTGGASMLSQQPHIGSSRTLQAYTHETLLTNRPIRAKVVTLSSQELLLMSSTRLFAIGCLLQSGHHIRMTRRVAKLSILGQLLAAMRKRRMSQLATQFFSLGFPVYYLCLSKATRHRASLFAVGLAVLSARKGKTKHPTKKPPSNTSRLHWNTNVPSSRISGSVFDRSGRRASVMLPGGSTAKPTVGRGSLGQLLDPAFVQQAAEEFQKAGSKKPNSSLKTPRKPKVSFFSGSAARNYGISLARCQSVQPFREVANALLGMDIAAIKSIDMLDTLAQLDIFDNTAAIRGVRQYTGDAKLLEVPDAFVHEVILKVPQVKSRINAMRFMVTQTEMVRECQKVGGLLLQCCRSVRHSAALADVLGIMLRLGKEIQAATGSNPEDISGFKITSLCSLMKSTSRGGKKFGELLVEALLANGKQAPDVEGQLEPILRIRAATLTLDVLNRNISSIGGAEVMLKTLSSQLFGPAQLVVQEALQSCSSISAGLKRLLESVIVEYQVTCQFLLEDESTSPPILFGALQQFVNAFSNELTRVQARNTRQTRSAASKSPKTVKSEPQQRLRPKSQPVARSWSLARKTSKSTSLATIPEPPSQRPAPPPKTAKRKVLPAAPSSS